MSSNVAKTQALVPMIGFLDFIASLACGPYAIAIIANKTFSQYPFSIVQFYAFVINRQISRQSIKYYEKTFPPVKSIREDNTFRFPHNFLTLLLVYHFFNWKITN